MKKNRQPEYTAEAVFTNPAVPRPVDATPEKRFKGNYVNRSRRGRR